MILISTRVDSLTLHLITPRPQLSLSFHQMEQPEKIPGFSSGFNSVEKTSTYQEHPHGFSVNFNRTVPPVRSCLMNPINRYQM